MKDEKSQIEVINTLIKRIYYMKCEDTKDKIKF